MTQYALQIWNEGFLKDAYYCKETVMEMNKFFKKQYEFLWVYIFLAKSKKKNQIL